MKSIREYYKTVEKYHALAEASHTDQMVDVSLIRPHVASEGLVVDVGGGTGFNADLLSIPANRYVAVDLSRIGLQQVKTNLRGESVLCDTGLLPFRDAVFSTVLCSWSLEHFAEPQKALEEMLRVTKPAGRIIIWGPNWDNIFRKDFPQFVHKPRWYTTLVRWELFARMLINEVVRSRYRPYVNTDVAALRFPERYVSKDFDAAHCVLCQETVRFFLSRKCTLLFLADFSHMRRHMRNERFIRVVRATLKPLLPALKRVPLLRWFVACFPLVVQVPYEAARVTRDARP